MHMIGSTQLSLAKRRLTGGFVPFAYYWFKSAIRPQNSSIDSHWPDADQHPDYARQKKRSRSPFCVLRINQRCITPTLALFFYSLSGEFSIVASPVLILASSIRAHASHTLRVIDNLLTRFTLETWPLKQSEWLRGTTSQVKRMHTSLHYASI